MAHRCFEHLDYIGGSYPYECVAAGCGRRFSVLDVQEHQVRRMREQDAERAAAGQPPAAALVAWEDQAEARGDLPTVARRTCRTCRGWATVGHRHDIDRPAPTLTLVDLVAGAEIEARPPWWEAHRHAVDRLGASLAGHIQWSGEPDEYGTLGTLAGTDRAVTLRYVAEEPGAEGLQVRVPCPEDSACPGPAWDQVTGLGELLSVLDGDEIGPWCQHHDA